MIQYLYLCIFIILLILIGNLYFNKYKYKYKYNNENFKNNQNNNNSNFKYNKQNYCSINNCPPHKNSNKYIYCVGQSNNKYKKCPPPNSHKCIC